jgi:hypothetical protein
MIKIKEFATALELSQDLESCKARLIHSIAAGRGGPRDQQFRQAALELGVLLFQTATRSETLPDEALILLHRKVRDLANGVRQTMVAEGIDIPGSACER